MTRELTKLQQAVIEQLGYAELDDEALQVLKDVCRGGADAGFGGFTYYTETCKFYDENKSLILHHLKNNYQYFGYDSLTMMVQSFNCFKDYKNEVELFLLGLLDNEDDVVTIKNGLAWYALEETAKELGFDLYRYR